MDIRQVTVSVDVSVVEQIKATGKTLSRFVSDALEEGHWQTPRGTKNAHRFTVRLPDHVYDEIKECAGQPISRYIIGCIEYQLNMVDRSEENMLQVAHGLLVHRDRIQRLEELVEQLVIERNARLLNRKKGFG